MTIEKATKEVEVFKQKIGLPINPSSTNRLDSNGKSLSAVIIKDVIILEQDVTILKEIIEKEEDRKKYRFLPYVCFEDYPNGGNSKKIPTTEFRIIYSF